MRHSDKQRRAGFLQWFEKREQLDNGRGPFMEKMQITSGRMSQLVVEKYPFGEAAAEAIEKAYELPDGYFLAVGRKLIGEENAAASDKLPTNEAGTPGNAGHTTHVNPNINLGGQGQIWDLPLLTLGRAELAREPNMTDAVKQFERIKVLPRLDVAPDFDNDKAMILPHDVAGTRALKGDIAVFRPMRPGDKPEPSKKPILVKSPSGTYHLVSYDAMAMAPLEAVAYCYYFYEP